MNDKKVEKLKRKLKKYKKKTKKYKSIVKNFQEGISCPICLDILALPYSLTCGHTFCYTCIHGWLENCAFSDTAGDGDSDGGSVDLDRIYAKSDPTCPVCRCVIERHPVKNMVIANQVDELVREKKERKVREYKKKVERAREVYKRDSSDGALNVWKDFVLESGVKDEEDGIKRCTRCLWEIVGNECSNCGTLYGRARGGESDFDSEDVLMESSTERDEYLDTDEEDTFEDLKDKSRFVVVECEDDQEDEDLLEEEDPVDHGDSSEEESNSDTDSEQEG